MTGRSFENITLKGICIQYPMKLYSDWEVYHNKIQIQLTMTKTQDKLGVLVAINSGTIKVYNLTMLIVWDRLSYF